MAATNTKRPLNNMHVVACGALSSMTHARFAEFVSLRGGVLTRKATPATSLIVEGENAAGTPRFQQLLQDASASGKVEVVTENQLFRRLGLLPASQNCGLFTIADVASLSGVSGKTLRRWIDLEIVTPVQVDDGVSLFEYAQLADAHNIAALIKLGATPHSIRLALHVAAANGQPLQAAQLVHCHGQQVGYRSPSGQLLAPDGTPAPVGVKTQSSASILPMPIDFNTAVQRALELEQEEEYQQAEEIYQQILAAGPEDEVIYFNLGNVQLAMDAVQLAIASYRKSVQLDPLYAEAWNNLGNAYCQAYQWSKAKAAYKTAIHHAPQYYDAHFNLAGVYFQLEQWASAARFFRHCLQSSDTATRTAAEQMLEEIASAEEAMK